MKRLHLPALLALALGACNSTPSESERDLSIHREYAALYFERNQLDEASRQIELGLEIEPDDDKLLLMKGWLFQKRGTRDDIFAAEQLFRRLARSADYRAMLGLGEALERKGVLYAESADAVERGKVPTKAADPKQRAAELRRDAAGFWSESIEWYGRTLGKKSGEIQAINGLQRVCALSGDLEQSLKWSNELLSQSEQEIAFWRGQLQRPDLRAKDEAEYRRRVNASSKLLIETHLTASTALLQLGRAPDALPHLDAAIELAPAQADIYSRRAQLRRRLGALREAREDINQFLRLSTLDPKHPDVERALDLLAECSAALEAGDKRSN